MPESIATGRFADAAPLVFEYLAVTMAEEGRTVPTSVEELTPVLRQECEHLPEVYAAPNELFVAYRDGRALMARAHRQAAALGLTAVELDVLASRSSVIAFYRRLGYVDPPAGQSGVMVDLVRPVAPADGRILITEPD